MRGFLQGLNFSDADIKKVGICTSAVHCCSCSHKVMVVPGRDSSSCSCELYMKLQRALMF